MPLSLHAPDVGWSVAAFGVCMTGREWCCVFMELSEG
jgi:hypothetical protein